MVNSKRGQGFFTVDGEMAVRIREFQWSDTTLGAIDQWPVSLRTSVSNMLRTQFPMLVLWGRELICFYNDAVVPSLGVERHPALGKLASEVFKVGWGFTGPLLEKVLTTGESVTFRDQLVESIRSGSKEDVYWTFCYSQILGDDAEPGGVLVTCLETTDRVLADKRAAEREKNRLYETIIGATPDLAYVFDLQYRFTYANGALLQMWGKSADDAIGKGLRDNGYEEWHAAMHEREIDQIVATGQQIRGEVSFPHAILGRRVYDYILVPVFNEKGEVEAVAGTTRDISELKHAELMLRESEERFRELILQAPAAIALFRGDDFIAEIANDAYLAFVDKKPSEFIGIPLFESLPHIRQSIEPIARNVVKTGETFLGRDFEIMLNRHGVNETAYFDFSYSPLREKDGRIDGFMVVATEVTGQVMARRKVEEKESALANAIELAELGTWQLDVASSRVTFSQRHAEILGLKEYVLNQEDSLSIIVEDDRKEVREKFDAAMSLGSGGRYEAEYRIINLDDGKTYIIHALGQSYFDHNGRVIRMEGTAQDVTVQRELQLALENEVHNRTLELAAANEELQAANEELVATNEELSDSTLKLTRSNEELSQFAHVASHDLQEPVRKISVFVEKVFRALPEMDERARIYLEKIDASANRMLNLIRGVLTHSQISNRGTDYEKVDLNEVLAEVLGEYDLLIDEPGRQIIVKDLPVIEASKVQMSQLFGNLISNSLKFSIPGKPLVIEISSEELDDQAVDLADLSPDKRYYKIQFRDNGIGFSQNHAEQIFEIFQRLHSKTEYSGTGIGLATCKKIVQNHGGSIYAVSAPGEGAVFHIILPEIKPRTA